MTEFVEKCRREWKRLAVPDAVADEMARELAADLEEAEAEGASASEVLGSGASDPRSFAASWAIERGLADPRAMDGDVRRRPPVLAALTTAAALALVGASLAILAADSGSGTELVRIAAPSSQEFVVDVGELSLATVTPQRIVLMSTPGTPPQDSGFSIHPQVGWTLLVLGLVVLVLALLLWAAWARARPRAAAA